MTNWNMSEFTFKDGKWWSVDDLDPLSPLPEHERGFKMADDEDGTITDGQLECVDWNFESMRDYVDHFTDGGHDEELDTNNSGR